MDEPEVFASDSGESKYSNHDLDEKDHLAQELDAVLNAMKKFKNADKIVQLNGI